jgi:GT2 family glycosyltransferase
VIAVCAPIWNRLPMTTAWVESVRRNSPGHEVKIYLADNGSTDDGAAEAIKALADWHIRYEDNGSLQRPANRLMRQAQADGAELIVYSNNDCLMGPGWLDALVREANKRDRRYFLPHNIFTNPHTFEADVRAALATAKPECVPGCAGWCMVFPPEALDICLPIPETFTLWYGDAWMNRKLEQAGWRCEVVLDSFVLHYGSVSFYARKDYVPLVEQDRLEWERLIREGA